MATTDGGAAFPRPSKLNPDEVSGDQSGMSLRDWFAGQALAGLTGKMGWSGTERGREMAQWCYYMGSIMVEVGEGGHRLGRAHQTRRHPPREPGQQRLRGRCRRTRVGIGEGVMGEKTYRTWSWSDGGMGGVDVQAGMTSTIWTTSRCTARRSAGSSTSARTASRSSRPGP